MTHTHFRSDRDGLLGEVIDEFFESIARGESPEVADYMQRYPEIAEQLKVAIPALNAAEDAANRPRFASLSEDKHPAQNQLGDFRILRQLGRGGMGIVYEAEQITIGRRVALKVLPLAGLVDQTRIQRFHNEVRAVAALNHPHIVSVYTVGEERGVHYFAMQLIHGSSLAQVISSLRAVRGSGEVLDGQSVSEVTDGTGRALRAAVTTAGGERDSQGNSVESAAHGEVATIPSSSDREYFRSIATLGIQAASALQHAHGQGVIHRDIKPANLLIDRSSQIYVTDFGLARVEADVGVTMTGDLVGTLRYMAPEQALAKRVVVDHRADIYSLGVTLYELLTLRPAYTATDRRELLKQIAFEEPPSPRRLDPAIPFELDTIVHKTISKDADERYSSADELADDLRRFLDNRPIRAKPPTPWQIVAKWTRRNPSTMWAAFVTLALVTLAFGVSSMFATRQRDNAIQQLRVSNSMRLAAQSQALMQNSPVLSALLAVEAVQTTQRHDGTVLPIAREVLMTATSELGGVPLVGHADRVLAASISPDNRWLVTGSKEGPRLWDLTSKERPITSRLLPHPGARGVAISRDGRWIISGSESVRLWRLNVAEPADFSIELVDYPEGKEGRTVVISDNSRWAVASFYDGGVVRAWDLAAKDPKSSMIVLKGHAEKIGLVIDISADGRRLVTGSLDGTALVWELESEDPTTPKLRFDHGSAVQQVAMSPNGRWLVTASDRPRLWDLSADEPTASAIPLRNQGDVHSIALSQDSLLAIAGGDTACLYDLDTADPAASCIEIRGHQGALKKVAISPNGRWLVTGGFDRRVRLWDLDSLHPHGLPTVADGEGHAVRIWSADDRSGSPNLLVGHDNSISAMAITSDSKQLITGGWGGNVRIWNLDSNNPAANRVLERKHIVQAVGVSPDGKWLVVGFGGANSRLWQLNGQAALSSSVALRGAMDGIGTFVISPDSHWLIATSAVPIYTDTPNHERKEKVARVWDLKADDPGEQAFQLRGHQGAVTSIAISGDANLVATGSVDTTVRIWDLSTGKGQLVRELAGHGDKVHSVAMSADGGRLVTAAHDGTAYLWDLTTEPVVKQELRGHEEAILKIAISWDGRWVATGGSYEPARAWDLQSPEPLSPRIIPGHRRWVTGVAFSPDGRWLATGSWDEKTIVWDLHAKDPFSLPHLVHHNDSSVFSLAFSSDSRLLLSGCKNKPRVLNLAEPNPVWKSLALPERLRSYEKSVALTPDGRRAVTSGLTVRLWDLEIAPLLEYAKQLVGRELTAEERRRFSISDD